MAPAKKTSADSAKTPTADVQASQEHHPAGAAAVGAAMGASADDHMYQVRELLFGEQLRQVELRFAALEQQLRQYNETLRDDFERRLSQEQGQREQDGNQLEQGLKQLALDQENRISAVESDFQAALDEAQNELNQTLSQLVQQQQQDQQQLEQDKVSRTQMADLLQDLAEQLRRVPSGSMSRR